MGIKRSISWDYLSSVVAACVMVCQQRFTPFPQVPPTQLLQMANGGRTAILLLSICHLAQTPPSANAFYFFIFCFMYGAIKTQIMAALG